jgi:hypothetical protein
MFDKDSHMAKVNILYSLIFMMGPYLVNMLQLQLVITEG